MILKNYHRDAVCHRHAQPIHFGDNFTSLIALDLESLTFKKIKLDRIGAVEETRNPFQHEADHYTFSSPVASYQGIGRFVLGLLNDVVLEPLEFKEFVEGQVKNFL